MTVAHPRSCDRRPRGDRSSPAPPAVSGADLLPPLPYTSLPPPPACLPLNFIPAFLGCGLPAMSLPAGSGPGAGGAPPSSPASARPPSPARRLWSTVGGVFGDLDAPSPAACDAVNAALSSWRLAGCPSTAPLMAPAAPRGILRHPSAFTAPAPTLRRVCFNIPTPPIQDDEGPFPAIPQALCAFSGGEWLEEHVS
jgi:hypothetical protein